jgi:Methyltransferase domain
VSSPHPLAERLIERLQSGRNIRVLDFATGTGRNAEALRRAGFAVVVLSDEAAASDDAIENSSHGFDAVLSTHGLLHGTAASVAARVRSIAECITAGGWLFATFGSTSDSRYGRGERIDDSSFAPAEGDEEGVAHAYFDRPSLRALLEPLLEIESLEEQGVDEVVGSWAHPQKPTGTAHWFAVARKR